MEQIIKYEGKRKSFYELFSKDNYKIEIPIIQRDYAQGRESKSEVRELFLQALYEYLDQNIPNRDLDFVYGSTENDVDLEKFIPLDGQQRLTTLFLLHWYLANISGNFPKFKETMFANNKSKFTYLTRTSSSEFCDALFKNSIDISNLEANNYLGNNSVTDAIKDSDWYYLSWSKDSTINSMLTMLDAIHLKFKNKSSFYNRLIDGSNPIITFLYLDLGEYGLTEDLYIKMNSRGKPLTAFENFKAKLEQHIEMLFENDKTLYQLEFEGTVKSVDIKEYFSFNIDTKWANLFWNYRELAGNKNTFDAEMMNFVTIIATNQYAITPNLIKDNYTSILKMDSSDVDEKSISFYKLKDLNMLSKEFVGYLIKSFDNLANDLKSIKRHLDDYFYFKEDETFKNALKGSISRISRIQLHAYLRYFIVNDNNLSGLYQWMRVVHNLTENSDIDDPDKEIKAFLEIENLLPHSSYILGYLVSDECKIDSFFDRQVQEEQIKAHLIEKSDRWKANIEIYESTDSFKGQILFLFEFSGILDYFEINNNCSWSELEDTQFIASFKVYGEKAKAFFSLIYTPANEDFILERAVLTKGDYLIESGNDRFNFLCSTKVNNYLRDYSWRSLLTLPYIEYNLPNDWSKRRNLVKQLFDDSRYDINNLSNSLIDIIKDSANDWRKYFINNPELISYCTQGFIRFVNEYDITLIKNVNENSKMREMYTYNTYLNDVSVEDNFLPFDEIKHQEKNQVFLDSFISIKNWRFKLKLYSIEIYYLPNEKGDSGFYKISFVKELGKKDYEEFNDDIVNLLEENNFTWNEIDKNFEIEIIDSKETIDFVKELCNQFNKLP